MKCKVCGTECPKGSKYCLNCGTQLEEEPEIVEAEVVSEKKPAKVWKVFAKLGKIFGIIAISTSVIPFMSYFGFGVNGIICSCLGKKANDEESASNAKLGLTLSIIALCISVVMTIALTFIRVNFLEDIITLIEQYIREFFIE